MTELRRRDCDCECDDYKNTIRIFQAIAGLLYNHSIVLLKLCSDDALIHKTNHSIRVLLSSSILKPPTTASSSALTLISICLRNDKRCEVAVASSFFLPRLPPTTSSLLRLSQSVGVTLMGRRCRTICLQQHLHDPLSEASR